MTPPLITPATLISSFVFAGIAAYLAYKQKRNPYLWFCIGFLLGFFGVLGLFFAPTRRKKRVARKDPLAKPLPPPLQGPLNKFWYYLDTSHQQVGPMSYNAISKALHQGEICQNTFVWNEEMSEWKKVKDLLPS